MNKRREKVLMNEWLKFFSQKGLPRIDLGDNFHRECYKYGNPFNITKEEREEAWKKGTVI